MSSTMFDQDAEVSLLGAILMVPTLVPDLQALIRPDHFYKQSHGKVYEAILALDARGDTIDPITACDELTKRGDLEAAGGRPFVHSLITMCPSSAHWKKYADIVRTHAMSRRLSTLSSKIQDMQAKDKASPEEVLAFLGTALAELESGAIQNEMVPIRAALQECYEHLEKVAASGNHMNGAPSGLIHLDDILSGLRDSAVIVIAARPGMGKTAFALHLLRSVAGASPDKATALFSLEQPNVELSYRLISSETRIPSTKLAAADLNPEEWAKVHTAMADLQKLNIQLDDTADTTISQIRAKCRRLKRKHGLNLVVIDYVQLLAPEGRADNRQEEVAQLSRRIKLLAKELAVPTVVLAQLNRNCEGRADKRPELGDLRESGGIEQDADQVVMLYRDEYYDAHSPDKGVLEAIVRKNRHGALATARIAFAPEYGRFMNIPKKGALIHAA